MSRVDFVDRDAPWKWRFERMSTKRPLPIIAITAGDPCGIGPDVALTAATSRDVLDCCAPIIIGDRAALAPTRDVFHPGLSFVNVDLEGGATLDRAALAPNEVAIIEPGALSNPLPFGSDCAEGGRSSYDNVAKAIALGRRHLVHGIATAPISKTAWRMAGILAPGHTEVFADAFNAREWAMLLTSPTISVGLVTLHQPLSSVPRDVTTKRIVMVARLMDETLLRAYGKRPRLAILGLNPHAGENGLLGKEDGEIVAPAVEQARAAGLNVTGPLPPDTAFTSRARSRFDGYVCMYHDQGLIPFKMLAFEDGVNMTMGLEGIVRTSPDHGTAWDLAGKTRADASSMIAAVKLAARLAASNMEA